MAIFLPLRLRILTITFPNAQSNQEFSKPSDGLGKGHYVSLIISLAWQNNVLFQCDYFPKMFSEFFLRVP